MQNVTIPERTLSLRSADLLDGYNRMMETGRYDARSRQDRAYVVRHVLETFIRTAVPWQICTRIIFRMTERPHHLTAVDAMRGSYRGVGMRVDLV